MNPYFSIIFIVILNSLSNATVLRPRAETISFTASKEININPMELIKRVGDKVKINSQSFLIKEVQQCVLPSSPPYCIADEKAEAKSNIILSKLHLKKYAELGDEVYYAALGRNDLITNNAYSEAQYFDKEKNLHKLRLYIILTKILDNSATEVIVERQH